MRVAAHLVQPTQGSEGAGRSPFPKGNSPLLGLAPGGVCLAETVTRPAGGLLHRRFTLTPRPGGRRAVCFLWHYAVGSPRLAVSQHRALWSPDFPHPLRNATAWPTRVYPV